MSAELLAFSFGEQANLRMNGQTSAVSLPEGITIGEGGTPGSKALKFGGNTQVQLPNSDYFAADKPFSLTLWIYQPTGSDNFAVVISDGPG